jgi:hypothetical protein
MELATNLASVCFDLGEAREALALCEQVPPSLDTEEEDASDRARLNMVMASSHAHLGDFRSALLSAEKALAATTDSNLLTIHEIHLTFGKIYRLSAVYPFVVRLCLRMGRQNEAFGFVERNKSKAFLESLSGKLPHVTPSLTQRESKGLSVPSLAPIRYHCVAEDG